MNNFPQLIVDEKHLIDSVPLEESTKVGQIYCYLSSGPVCMVKIGKGKNGRQRMATWINEYPADWRNGKVIFIADRLNQSTSETALHRLFESQRVSGDQLREYLGIEEWTKLPDGASEWFHVDNQLAHAFLSAGIDLVAQYSILSGQSHSSSSHYDPSSYTSQQSQYRFHESEVEKTLENVSGLRKWDIDSDCRELTAYINALVGYECISHDRVDLDFVLTTANSGNHTLIRVLSTSSDCVVTEVFVNKIPDGTFLLKSMDIYTGLPLQFVRYRKKSERKDSTQARIEFSKTLVATIAQQVMSFSSPPNQLQETPELPKATYPNGRRFAESVTYIAQEKHIIPIKGFLQKLKSKLSYGGVYGKLTGVLPLGDLTVDLVESEEAGHFAVLIAFGSYCNFKTHIPALDLNIDTEVQRVLDEPDLQYDKLFDELLPNFSETQMRQARSSRSLSIVFTVILSAFAIGAPIWLGAQVINATGNLIENIRN